jgi:cell division protein FtsB
MPSPASSAARRSSRPAASGLGGAALRVRWDRVGRVALLVLLVGVALAYVGPARSLLSTWHESSAKQAQLRALEHEHEVLIRRSKALRQPTTVEAEARRLGMVRPGERSYVVRNLPDD